MLMDTIDKSVDNPVVFKFGLRGEFAAQQLLTFDYLTITIGDEHYSTVNDPEKLYVPEDEPEKLYLKIATTTSLERGEFPVRIKGYNLNYPNGYGLSTFSNPKIGNIKVL